MSLNCTATINASLGMAETLSIGLTTAQVSEALSIALTLTNGTGANKINERWDKQATASAAADTYTLSALTDSLGRTIAFAKIRGLLIINNDATHSLTVGNAGTHPWVGPFDAATDTVTIRPGGFLFLAAPDASGYAVTASSSDQLKIDPGANTITYSIAIVGE